MRPPLEEQHLVGQRDRGLAVGDQQQASRRPRRPRLRRIAARMRASTSGSTAEVASSRTSSRGRRTSARASESRCRCPPERVVPRSPSRLSSPCGSAGHEPVGLGGPQRLPDLVVADVGAERDVAAHGVVEEERRLRHQRDVPGQLAAARGRAGRCRRAGSRRRPGRPAGSPARSACSCRTAVAPTTATVRPGSRVKSRSSSSRWPGVVGVAEVVDLQPSAAASPAPAVPSPYVVSLTVSSTRWTRRKPTTRAGELAEQPADRADREGDDRQQVGDRDDVARVGRAGAHPPRRRRRARRARRGWAAPRCVGSNAARSRPARMLSSRSCARLGARTARSPRPRGPRVLTTIAPSKDSWAISLSSARSAWMRVIDRRGEPLVDHVGTASPAGRPAGRRRPSPRR